jgi:hypothetical protein
MKIVGLGQAQDTPTNLETVKMSIDADSVDVLMTNLTSLYSNPVRAIVREYSANALDSHTKSGQTKPVLVLMPTEQNPVFSVQDFGVGMSKDEIANVYSRYGRSTKTSNNSEIGGFGLGCKSALAIAERFDIVAVKDGVKTTAFIQKNARGVGVVHFVSEDKTSDANGVLITIPVEHNRISAFRENTSLFNTWAVGSVLVDGEPNKAVQYQDNYLPIAPAGEVSAWVEIKKASVFSGRNFYGYGSVWSNITFNIGGIAYELEKTWFGGDKDSITAKLANDSKMVGKLRNVLGYSKAVVNLPIGSIDLTPSREAIMITEKSVSTIVASLSDFGDAIRPAFQNYIQTLPIEQAYRVYANNFSLFTDEVDFSKAGYRSDYRSLRSAEYGIKYQGEVIPTFVEVKAGTYAELTSIEGQGLPEASLTSKVFSLNALNSIAHGYNTSDVPSNCVLVYTDVVNDASIAMFRKNLRDYSKAKNGGTTINAMLTSDAKPNKWIVAGYGEVITLDDFLTKAKDFRSAKKSASQVGVKRSAVSYAVLDLAVDNEINKVEGEKLGDGSGYIYIGIDQDNIGNFGDNNVWSSVNGVMSGTTGRVDEEAFFKALGSVFPKQKIVFITKNKSVDAFVKRYPKAVAYKTAFIAELIKVEKAGQLDILAGVFSLTSKNTSSYGYYSDTKIQDVLHAILGKGLLANIKNDYARQVLTASGSKNAFSVLASMLLNVKATDAPVVANALTIATEKSFGTRLSIISKMNFGWGVVKIEQAEAEQIVAFINAILGDNTSK